MKKLGFIAALFFIVAEGALAYERPTHEDMSEQAALVSVLKKDVVVLRNMGIPDIKHEFPNSKGNSVDIIELIRNGSNFEDSPIRPLNHFFDPTTDDGLLFTSPTWALEDKGQIPILQRYSYADARQYFHDAMTKPNKTEREKSFGLLFETLGRVIHHVQDMAQPQHVRLDTHLKLSDQDQPEWFFENRSRYELYTNNIRGLLRFDGYAAVYAGADTAVFTTPRQFWTTTDGAGNGGKGIAEYTNRGFFSAGTNVGNGRYALPAIDPAVGVDVDIADLCAEADATGKESCPKDSSGTMVLSGEMTFFSNMVTDTLRPAESRLNPRATTYSIFDQDLKDIGQPPAYSLNRFNFDAAHEFLVPRAVAYSAGLIDYFFRGKLIIEETQFSGNTINIFVRNGSDQPNVLRNGTFSLYYDATNGIRKNLPIQEGASVATFSVGDVLRLTASMPGDLDVSNDIPFALTFDGEIGNEQGIVGLAFGAVVSGGFVVTPSQTLPDGISGNRVITKKNGAWTLTSDTTAVGGNIDWKGWYIGQHPTRMLSWNGPSSRYGGWLGYPYKLGVSIAWFGYNIYMDGKVLAVTPQPVIGSALTKDASGNEWIIAICWDAAAKADVVLRRPNVRSNTPSGWEQIGNFPVEGMVDDPISSWFFNGSGTEAQTLRMVSGTAGSSIYPPQLDGKVERVKIRITPASATREVVGTYHTTSTYNFTTSGTCDDDGFGTIYSTTHTSIAGEVPVAVDYLNDAELIATMTVMSTSDSALSGRDGEGSSHGSFNWEVLLSWSSNRIVVFKRSGTGSSTQASRYSFEGSDAQEITRIHLMDLRNNFVVYTKETSQTTYSESGTQYTEDTHLERTNSISVNGAATIFYRGSRDNHVQYATSENTDMFRCNGFNYSINVQLTNYWTFLSTEGAFGGEPVIQGGGGIDAAGDVLVSLVYRDVSHNTGVFNFLSNGDITSATGADSQKTSFYPVKLR